MQKQKLLLISLFFAIPLLSGAVTYGILTITHPRNDKPTHTPASLLPVAGENKLRSSSADRKVKDFPKGSFADKLASCTPSTTESPTVVRLLSRMTRTITISGENCQLIESRASYSMSCSLSFEERTRLAGFYDKIDTAKNYSMEVSLEGTVLIVDGNEVEMLTNEFIQDGICTEQNTG